MNGAGCSNILALGAVAAVCLSGHAAGAASGCPCDHGVFPPTETTPRDPGQAAELYSLLEQAAPLPVEHPHLWEAMRAAQNRLPFAELDRGDPEALRTLICALWADYGAPELNEANQWFLAGVIADAAQRVAATADAQTRRALVEELLRYLDAGGAAVQPAIPALVARSLVNLMPEDTEIRSLAEQLVADAVQWEVEIAAVRGESPDDEVLNCGTAVLGPLFALQAYEMLEGTPAGTQPACYRRACIAIAAVLDTFEQTTTTSSQAAWRRLCDRLRTARRYVLRPCGSAEAREDLQCRFAVVLRTLLRSRRLPADPQILSEINRALLELLRRQSLSGPKAWRYWADAVLALRTARISHQLAREIQRQLDRSAARNALTDAQRDRLIRLTRQGLQRESKARPRTPGSARQETQVPLAP